MINIIERANNIYLVNSVIFDVDELCCKLWLVDMLDGEYWDLKWSLDEIQISSSLLSIVFGSGYWLLWWCSVYLHKPWDDVVVVVMVVIVVIVVYVCVLVSLHLPTFNQIRAILCELWLAMASVVSMPSCLLDMVVVAVVCTCVCAPRSILQHSIRSQLFSVNWDLRQHHSQHLMTMACCYIML